ncbi:hypothetical protein F5Y10DRAFT_18865 [Nemania abortiva]|nr:hypothetical protein F5Y10DRAFT_18865 [Nemania abortiva]
MATSPERSPTPQRTAAEDPDTAATRKELRQTAISEKPDSFAMAATSANNPPALSADAQGGADVPGKATTPELLPRDDAARDQISSPKKKRAHDEVDESKDATTGANADGDVSPIGSNGSTSLNRTNRSEPEKKRPRDVSSESKADPTATTVWITTATTTALKPFCKRS